MQPEQWAPVLYPLINDNTHRNIPVPYYFELIKNMGIESRILHPFRFDRL